MLSNKARAEKNSTAMLEAAKARCVPMCLWQQDIARCKDNKTAPELPSLGEFVHPEYRVVKDLLVLRTGFGFRSFEDDATISTAALDHDAHVVLLDVFLSVHLNTHQFYGHVAEFATVNWIRVFEQVKA